MFYCTDDCISCFGLQGITPTVLGILPYSGIKFFVYQRLKQAWTDADSNAPFAKPPVMVKLSFGAIAGLLAQTLTYPLDVIRRRMQVRQELA